MQSSCRWETCKRCRVRAMQKVVKRQASNGSWQVFFECGSCRRPFPKAGEQFLRQDDFDLEHLPLATSKQSLEVCCVCGTLGAELHHFAPRHLFPDASKWPTGFLCRGCHARWHTRMTPGIGPQLKVAR